MSVWPLASLAPSSSSASVDPVVPPARLKIAVDQAQAIGCKVEYRELLNQGHTLMVGAFLDQAVAWLSPVTPET